VDVFAFLFATSAVKKTKEKDWKYARSHRRRFNKRY